KSFALADTLGCASWIYRALGDSAKVREFADRQFALASELGLGPLLADSSAFRGWAIAQQGRAEEGSALIRSAVDSLKASGVKVNVAGLVGLLSSAQVSGGRLQEALVPIEEAVASLGEEKISALGTFYQRGLSHLELGEEAAAQQDFRTAIALAVEMGT